MLLFSILFPAIISSVLADGELLVARTPPSIQFKGDEAIDQSLLADVFSSSLGFTTQADSDWSGFTVKDPFSCAEAVVVLVVEGIPSLGRFNNVHKFHVNTNEEESLTWSMMEDRVKRRFPTENNTLNRIELGNDIEEDDGIETKHLDRNVDEDAIFLQELAELNKFMTKSQKVDGVPDVYWFVLRGLHALTDLRGPHHPTTVEAKEKVHEALMKLAKVYGSMYHNRALVAALVSDASHTRKARSLLQEQETGLNTTQGEATGPKAREGSDNTVRDPAEYNLATAYSDSYPAIFNIILWFSIAFIMSLIAISVFIGSMDPGRDSIIYRMTSNRMKKDS